jgi:hypothetical protein
LGGEFLPSEEKNSDFGEEGAAFSGGDGRRVKEACWYSLVGEIRWKGGFDMLTILED